ncbi:MAG: alpha amylase C-terminal domain-containing protein, partial [Rhabdochlamydiaceae bacterium]
FTHPGKKLLFMGSEFAQENEWNFRTSLEWSNAKNQLNSKFLKFVHDINELYRTKRALYELDSSYEGFEWVDFRDTDQSVIGFIRKPKDGSCFILAVCNMTPVPRYDYRVGVPEQGFYKEILNSDAVDYGGSGAGNLGGVSSEQVSWHGRPHSINLTLPPLGIAVFEIQRS